MKQKIDNEKMWASILKRAKHIKDQTLFNFINWSFKDQGLQYNPETKEIESIEQPSEHKLVEAVANEPIEQKPKFKEGDTIRKKGEDTNIITIERVDESFYYAGSYNLIIEIADKEWELVSPEVTKESDQELTEFESTIYKIVQLADATCSSPNDLKKLIKKHCKELLSLARNELAKDARVEQNIEVNGGELTDFEKVLAECINKAQCSALSPEGVAIIWSDQLLDEARKDIVAGIDVDKMVNYVKSIGFAYPEGALEYQKHFSCYKQGIEDTINVIKKGE